ncbi:hypothetical protein DERP_005945 [Dermatophagoides pteronyssinus]|uniref:Uncharacterized protein n=1 Tax=Dermatophagoides pteronyssinus TaxID=6956 RepID=A0ABQ8JSC9_DERPT|nr:hypothetical protein DERP_005945 [Dermatophagoides pteronyssinus]
MCYIVDYTKQNVNNVDNINKSSSSIDRIIDTRKAPFDNCVEFCCTRARSNERGRCPSPILPIPPPLLLLPPNT